MAPKEQALWQEVNNRQAYGRKTSASHELLLVKQTREVSMDW